MNNDKPCTDGGLNPKHHATHVIDDGCSRIVTFADQMIEAALTLGAKQELESIVSATKALHAKAKDAHAKFEGH